MFKKKYFFISFIVIISIMVGAIFLYRYLVLRSENNQIEILTQIFNEVCDEDENINLKNSAQKNFVTGEDFKDDSLLVRFDNNKADQEKMFLSIKYNKKEKILTVTKENQDNTYSYIQMYKVDIGINRLKYKKYGNFVETFVSN